MVSGVLKEPKNGVSGSQRSKGKALELAGGADEPYAANGESWTASGRLPFDLSADSPGLPKRRAKRWEVTLERCLAAIETASPASCFTADEGYPSVRGDVGPSACELDVMGSDERSGKPLVLKAAISCGDRGRDLRLSFCRRFWNHICTSFSLRETR